AARNRFKRTNLVRGFGSDHEVEAHSYLPYSTATRNETQPRLMYLRKISFQVSIDLCSLDMAISPRMPIWSMWHCLCCVLQYAPYETIQVLDVVLSNMTSQK
ncbi:unnamed protein product, partial [Brassica oleracea]